ncbi:purine-cytosine permease family protein [Teichococcus aestuarii]|uniref:purine-cytosine permease family protein n=1 Tax=Teichococcus aestuarii TaxID=568898 RepID=UPI00361AEC8C
MATRQRILRIRRDYNRWVADETMEDYALRFTAVSARKWSAFRVANTALGSISFLALEAIGGALTVAYGFTNSVAAILFVSALIFVASLPICLNAARAGVDIDLLTRGAGFGYIGSTVTSLIYASFTFIFFGIEAVILADMLESFFGVPLWLGYLASAVVVVPLVTHGITFISRVQTWTQPVWLVLNVLPLIALLVAHPDWLEGWTHYAGEQGRAGFDLLAFGAAASVLFALITQTGEQVDYIRFLPPRDTQKRWVWWTALLAGGPGWIAFDVLKLLAGSALAYAALQAGLSATQAVQPAEMYRPAFGALIASPGVALAVTAAFVALSQIKINVTNAYAGSLAWSNFFSRLTHSHPGRVVWLVFNIAVALLLMELGVYNTIEQVLFVYSNVAAAWMGALVADLTINKPLGLSPPGIEFKRAHLYDVNPVGVGSMALSVLASFLAYYGALGAGPQAFATFIAFGVAFAAAPALAWATGGRYYGAQAARRLGRAPRPALRHLRARLRAARHGLLPRLHRPHLFALLHARRPLRRWLQAACPALGADHDAAARRPAGGRDAGADHAGRLLHGGVPGLRRHHQPRLPRHPRADAGQPASRHRLLEGLLRARRHRRHRRLDAGAGAPVPPRGAGGDAPADQPADERDPRPQAHRRRLAEGQGGGRARQPGQEPLRHRHLP